MQLPSLRGLEEGLPKSLKSVLGEAISIPEKLGFVEFSEAAHGTLLLF
jgi:hypothetical protein